MRARLLLYLLLVFSLVPTVAAESPLKPLKRDSPRDTMESFMTAMEDYHKGIQTGDRRLKRRLRDAVRCFDLAEAALVVGDSRGEMAAIYLKEVIDRVIIINYDLIPSDPKLNRWRLKDTEIEIVQIVDGPKRGRFLFSRETASRASDFYEMVEHLPYLAGSGKGAGYKKAWSPKSLPDWALQDYISIPAWQWISIFVSILLGLIIKVIVQHVVHLAKMFASKTRTQWDLRIVLAIEKPIGLFVAATFWLYAIHILRFKGTPELILTYLVKIVFSIAVIWTVYQLVDVLVEYLQSVTTKTENRLDDHLVPMIRKALKLFVVVMGTLVMFQNLGVQVMSVLAGLGLGGLAFALAAKDTCANLFGSIMILLDRPFQIGDWVIIGKLEGTVEEIGFRSTRIRTFYNSLLTVPNSTLANASVDNMGEREYRRIKAYFGLTYDTPPEKMEAFLEGVKNVVEANPHTRKDYYHVVFDSYGDFSLNVMLYCFLKVPDWSAELVERQHIYLEIMRLAEKIGVDFAFPTQSLHMETFPEKEGIRTAHEIDEAVLASTSAAFGPGGEHAKPAGMGLFVAPYKMDRGSGADAGDGE